VSSSGRIYVETSVISYLASRPSRDIRIAAHQQMTAEWWDSRRADFDLFVSQLVIQEASAGDSGAAARRLAFLEGIPLLALTDSSLQLAERLLSEGAVPRGSEEDALHIALAAVHGVDYLLTWNFKHIANATLRMRIAAICVGAGHPVPVICTVEELLEA
jgi:predicted nucleic acid-binding protein